MPAVPHSDRDADPDSLERRAALRVLQIEPLGYGGLAHYVDCLATALAEAGLEVTILTARRDELQRAQRPRSGVHVVSRLARWVPPPDGQRPRWLWNGLRKLQAVIDALYIGLYARRDFDIVHLHGCNREALLQVVALRMAGRRPVLTAHQLAPHEPVPGQAWIYRRLFRLCGPIIVHSQTDVDRVRAQHDVEAERVHSIPHGEYGFFERLAPVDRESARAGLGLDPDAKVVLFFGYLRSYKGFDTLLESWPTVAAAEPRARLLIAGDPVRLRSEERRLLERAHGRDGIDVRLGYVPVEDVSALFAAADTLALPYREISQSGVLYAGFAMGVPVVASAIAPWTEQLTDGESALFVSPDSPDELASALLRVLTDEDLAARLIEGGRRQARRHSWPAIAKDTIERVYSSQGARSG